MQKVELNLEPVALHAVLEGVAASLRAMATAKGLELIVSAPARRLVVQTDRRVLTRIVLDLLGNAIEFTERGFVRMLLGRKDADGQGMVHIRIEDTGVGMRPQNLSGKLAQVLGGTIDCRSECGKGSIFTLRLGAP